MTEEALRTASIRIPMLVERYKPGERVVSIPGKMRGKVLAAKNFLSGRRYRVQWENGYVGVRYQGARSSETRRRGALSVSFVRSSLPPQVRSSRWSNSDQAFELKLTEAAHLATIESLQKRKLIDATGAITLEGEAALKRSISRNMA